MPSPQRGRVHEREYRDRNDSLGHEEGSVRGAVTKLSGWTRYPYFSVAGSISPAHPVTGIGVFQFLRGDLKW
jgi:hypothetical protein